MIACERIDRSQDGILRNLYEHYVHDMSEWLGIDTHADGSFGYDTSPLWQGDYTIYLAKVGNSLAGFGVIGSARQRLGRPEVRDMKDFFVLRRFRHQGVANAFIAQLWDECRSEWLIRVLVANKPALPFWRRAVRDYTQGNFEERSLLERGHDSLEREWVHLHFDNRIV